MAQRLYEEWSILAAFTHAGHSQTAVARHFGTTVTIVQQLLSRYQRPHDRLPADERCRPTGSTSA